MAEIGISSRNDLVSEISSVWATDSENYFLALVYIHVFKALRTKIMIIGETLD